MGIEIKIIIYLVGCAIAYFALRKSFVGAGVEWTLGDRIICLALSVLSWVAVGAGLIIILIGAIYNTPRFNKKSKW